MTAPVKGRKSKAEPAKTPAKEAPKVKEPKTPRGKAKKDETKEKDKEEDKEKTDEELVSRSGRKIRPKRYIDEQTEENATLPSPAPKRRRGASPATEKADSAKEKVDTGKEKNEKSFTQFNAVKQSELEVLKVPFKPVDEEKDNILIAYLPNGTYVGVKLFQSRPRAFKNESSRLQWEKQAAANAVTLKTQLERNQITPQSVQGQLVMDLNLTDEEKATLDKERDTEEKRSRVNFLKSEMKLIDLDAKIKTCLSLEKADTELCLTLLDELLSLDVKPLMLLKHPTCLETVKRMRAYVGNTPSWDLSESDALVFSKQAHKIRKKADLLYKNMKGFFHTPDGLSFWEFFSERVRTFKEITGDYHAAELLELVHEPLELDQPHAHTMKSAIEKANNSVPPLPEDGLEDEDKHSKKKGTTGKSKKPHTNSTPSKSKRQSSRNKTEDDKSTPEEPPSEPQKPAEESTKEKETEVDDKTGENNADSVEKTGENDDGGEKTAVNSAELTEVNSAESEAKDTQDIPKEPETTPQETNQDVEMAEVEKTPESEQNSTETSEKEKEQTSTENLESTKEDIEKNTKDDEIAKKQDTEHYVVSYSYKETDKPPKEEKSSKKDKKSKEDKSEEKRLKEDENEKSGKDHKNSEKSTKDTHKSSKDTDKSAKSGDKSAKTRDKSPKPSKEDKHSKDSEKREKRSAKEAEKSSKDSSKNGKESDKSSKEDKSEEKEEKNSDEKDKQESGEPRAKRSRESKKIEAPPPRSPAKRKSKV